MIQKTSQRQLNAVVPRPRTQLDVPQEWGQWVRNRHYSLEVAQHPLRARMCGFGDKDRRPLAPAAVAQMVVRREDNSVLDVDDIDVDFFLVTVDLWSADGTQEMNLVLHPSSADRYVPLQAAKPRKRGPGGAPPPPATPPSRPSPYPLPHDRGRPPPAPSAAPLRPIDAPGRPPAPAYPAAPFPFPPLDPFAGPPDPVGPWSYPPPPLDRTPFHAPTLPSIHSLGRGSTEPAPAPFPAPDAPDLSTPFRGWGDVAAGLFDPQGVDPALPDAPGPRWSSDPLLLPAPPPADPWPSPVPVPPSHHAFQPFGQSPVLPPQQEIPQQLQASRDGQHTIPSLPRHTYTRTLVGPLSANAQRLQDEHRKPAIFFLFQDLSVRTEGTFRLRMRLMNVGVPPAPNGLANSVHTGVSPVLAQIFTEPFTVYSAKRFPGVPNTTALSIAFGNQGQKLPLRNRHGTAKPPRRPLRSGTVSSDEDSS